VWRIFNLDLEYTKYKEQKAQILDFIRKSKKFAPELWIYEYGVQFVKKQRELNNFSPLINFISTYYPEELALITEE
jgi:hypothetical protein